MPLIQTENLTKVYGKGEAAVVALDHVTMAVEPREIVAVMGPSGCGKSTLLHMLGGLDRPTEGQVTIDGSALASLSDDDLTQIRRRKIGFVFQFFNLIPILSSVENAALPLILDGKDSVQAKQKATEWLQKVGLGSRLAGRPDQLSAGQQQRVAIARALISDPVLVLAAIGTAFGLLVGLYLGYVTVAGLSASGIFKMEYTFPLTGVLAATAAGLIFGILAALIPARQAAQMEIIHALRYE